MPVASCTFYLTTLHDGSQLPESCPSATNERFRCADNVAALICLPGCSFSPFSLLLSLSLLPLTLSAQHDRWPRPAYFVFFGAWHLPRSQQSSPAPIRMQSRSSCPAPCPHPLPTLCSAYRIPAPILIAIANRCQNASMQSAALRSCCLRLLASSCLLLLLHLLPPDPHPLPLPAAFLFLLQFYKLRCVSRQAPRRTCCHLPHASAAAVAS